jgi:hypothetical protein
VLALSFVHIPDAKTGSDKNTKPSVAEMLRRLDLPGFFTFSPAVIMLLLALEWGGSTYPWISSVIIGQFCGAAAMFCIFLAWEYSRGEAAMLPLSLFGNRVVCCATLASAMAQGGFFLVFYYLPTWFQVVKNLSPAASGVHILPSVGSMGIGAFIAGVLGAARIELLVPY